MQKCIKKLMQIEAIADRRIAAIERKITNVAAFPFGDTERQIASVLRAIERKRAVERLLDAAKKVRLALKEKELLVLEMFARNDPISKIASATHTSKQAAHKHVKRVVKTTENVLFLLGYDYETLKRDCDLAYWQT